MSISSVSKIRTLSAICAVSLAGVATNAAAQALRPRAEHQKMTSAQMQSVTSSNRIHVKFREGNIIRLRDGQLNGISSTDADALRNTLVQRAIPATGIRRLFTRPEATLENERQAGQQRSGKELPDLNLWFVIDLPSGANAAEVANALNNLDVVEYAEPERLPSPLPTDISPPTPDFASSQTYKGDAPVGIGVPTSPTSNIACGWITRTWKSPPPACSCLPVKRRPIRSMIQVTAPRCWA